VYWCILVTKVGDIRVAICFVFLKIFAINIMVLHAIFNVTKLYISRPD